ncbi:pyridoxamine 5'-phosphate oxidase family protein [Sphingobacterium thalpophilum]|uniref:General stress protein 26 n=1 Tax=Sphingobacterium thalpophilum TaxID=259 RepID=A0A4U9W884_9SPHI|nr:MULTISPECIES: pyridoxamine 5'-phosphate oxidase family protein [Sphingobacterium]MCW8313979.1 pyridoxamine 5'-phosphate oxidase family protein [Sphingobacterium sp. InxBP1]VTR55074.1 General stress protein 26 [Sphingobacterium thalpophilum]
MAEKNISNKEALEKLRSIVDQIDIGTLCSFNKESDYPHGVPMSRQEVDDDGSIWYICSAESETFRNIENDPKISLFYADAKNYTFLSINGTGRLSRDQARIDRYWNKMMEGWFEKGKEDPNIRLLQVTPVEAHYWDSNSNMIINLFQMLKATITGNTDDIGKEGDLNL